MANIKRVEVQKDNKRKSIYESELPTYLAMGWKQVPTYNTINYNKIK